MGRPTDRALAESSDAELLSLLRDGETEAYTELWRRHIRAALRVAHRLAPGQADDLAAESFLAVYRQVAVVGNGPEESFRAYLFATMRNTAVSWHRHARNVETDPDLDEIELNDGLSTLEDRARAAEILDAFESLPERWQRVLWLAEVEDAKRREIAAEFGIKPNAVSALYRRARAGLRLQWLTGQVPPELRESREHVARLIPALLVEGRMDSPGREITDHLRRCEACAESCRELRSSYSSMRRGTLAVAGFAGLGTVLSAAQVPLAAAGVGSAAMATASGAGVVAAIAAGIAVLAAGGAITATVMLGSPHSAEASTDGRGTTEAGSRAESGGDGEAGADRSGQADRGTATGPRAPGPVGRGNADAGIPSYVFALGGEPSDFSEAPSRPRAAPPGSIPGPPDEPDGSLRSGITTPNSASGYLAPVLAGTTAPGAQVAIELVSPSSVSGRAFAPEHFSVQADAAGAWSFDARAVTGINPGTYEYRVWAFTDAEVSPVDSGAFTLSTLALSGFESLRPFEFIPLSEASTTGIVFQARGPAGGSICLASLYSGQTVEIPLDAAGVSVKRLRFTTGGTYLMSFRACADGYHGPATELFVDVSDPDGPIFGPFGPDPALTVFEISDP